MTSTNKQHFIVWQRTQSELYVHIIILQIKFQLEHILHMNNTLDIRIKSLPCGCMQFEVFA